MQQKQVHLDWKHEVVYFNWFTSLKRTRDWRIAARLYLEECQARIFHTRNGIVGGDKMSKLKYGVSRYFMQINAVPLLKLQNILSMVLGTI